MQSAKNRADEIGITNVRFMQGDVGKLPFKDESIAVFNCVK
ncbi:hypothetical protein [Pseudobutyrivibrio ruminis]